MAQPKLYHLIALFCCAAFGFIVGIYNLIQPLPSTKNDSRLERIFDQLLSVGFMVFSTFVLFRKVWAIDGLIFLFALSIFENLRNFRREDFLITKRIAASKVRIFWSVFVLLVFSIPISLLIWLRPIFTAH